MAGLKTTAKLDDSGKYYIVNGMKKTVLIIPNIRGQVITSRIITQGHKISLN